MALTRDERLVLTPTYHVLGLIKWCQSADLVPLTAEVEQIDADGTRIPPVSVSARVNGDGKVLVTLCNVHPERQSSTAQRSQSARLTTPGIPAPRPLSGISRGCA